jgi:phosphatidylserine/phosphatidylglycerophosphate/cardiolipin synthase-like enzyme
MSTLAFAIVDPQTRPRESVPAGVRVYSGPSQQAADADLAALAAARRSIDMAAFVLTDRAVIGALSDAARRGAKVRVYLDHDEMARSSARVAGDLAALAGAQGVAIRYKARRTDAMHLKAYAIDDRLLRTGSANFSYSGERYQDNDVVMLESPALAAAFAREFEAMWTRADNEDYGK